MRKVAASTIIALPLTLAGCGDIVLDPISPQQARAEVVDAARDIVTTLHADVVWARFSYESCNDQGEPPFRGEAKVSFWMPGISHDQPVNPQTVIKALVADGWSTDSDFISHAPTLRKDKVNIILTVAPRPAGNGHAWVDVDGQCRDTFDHRKDDSILGVNIKNELQP
jgi:hypothetical protein